MEALNLSIADVIRTRRTIRHFNQDELTEAVILDLLDVAVWAPNHGLREPWRFIGITEPKAKEKLADWIVESLSQFKRVKWLPSKIKHMYKEKIKQIPAVLFVVVKLEKNSLKRDEDFAATSALIQNLQLYGWERGVGMIWSIDEMLCGNQTFCRNLGIRSDERIAGMLYMGYFDTIPKPKKRTPAVEKITWI